MLNWHSPWLLMQFHQTLLFFSKLVNLVLNNLFYNSNVYLYLYMFIYNVTLSTLLFILFSAFINNFKTLHSFSNFSFDSFYLLVITFCIFSLAGVPPFVGFFSKLFILNIVSNTNFFLMYFSLFIVLFLGLYFYIQNIRFLHSTNSGYSSHTYISNEKKNVPVYYFSIFSIILLSLGFIFIDDLLLIFMWLLS